MTLNIDPETLGSLLGEYSIRIATAILILVIGRILAGLIRRLIKRVMNKAGAEPTLTRFFASLAYFALLAFVAIAAMAELGIQTASFIAVLGAAGLAVGMALQGSLSHFAAGVMLIVFKPFKVGDFIEGAGTAGTVEQVGIFNTILKTGDNQKIVIPNAKLSNDNIVNYSAFETRRINFDVGISYDDQPAKAREVLMDIMQNDERILQDPEPKVVVTALADSAVNLNIRCWVNSGDYWGTLCDLQERIKQRFDEEGVSIPYPHQQLIITRNETLQ